LLQRTETLFTDQETLLITKEIKEIKIKIVHNQLTNYVSKSKETYHTKNTDSRETERNKTEKISTETEKQTN